MSLMVMAQVLVCPPVPLGEVLVLGVPRCPSWSWCIFLCPPCPSWGAPPVPLKVKPQVPMFPTVPHGDALDPGVPVAETPSPDVPPLSPPQSFGAPPNSAAPKSDPPPFSLQIFIIQTSLQQLRTGDPLHVLPGQTQQLLLIYIRMVTWNQILDPWVYILFRRAVLQRLHPGLRTRPSLLSLYPVLNPSLRRKLTQEGRLQ